MINKNNFDIEGECSNHVHSQLGALGGGEHDHLVNKQTHTHTPPHAQLPGFIFFVRFGLALGKEHDLC